MSRERRPAEPAEPDPYWQDDVAVGEGRFSRGETYSIRLRLHTATERFHRHQELIPLAQSSGERVYVHAKPYILVPDITLTVGLYDHPSDTGAIGEVSRSDWTGMHHEEVGQMQAWFYPADALVLLWECFSEDRYRGNDPTTDPTLATLWTGFAAWLLARFPTARRLVTTWEPLYDRPRWQAFLTSQGYEPVTPATFRKQRGGQPSPPTEHAPWRR